MFVCNSKTQTHLNTHKGKRERYIEIECVSILTLELKTLIWLSKISNLNKGEEGSSYRAFCLVKLTRQASNVWRGAKCKTAVIKYLQKQMNCSRPPKNAILAKVSADRQQMVLTGITHCRLQENTSRWPMAMAGDVRGCLTRYSLPLQGKTQVLGAKPDT